MGVKIGDPKDFWKRIKSISVAEIAREANRPLSVAVIGDTERRDEAIKALYALESTDLPPIRALPEPSFVEGYDALTEEAHFPRAKGVFDFVIDVGGEREGAPEGTPIYSVKELGGWENTLERILEDRPDLSLALARNFPVFRRRVAQNLISQTAMTNAQFSLITGVATAFPVLEVLFPLNAISDIMILTKNQIMLILRLAAAYGLEVEPRKRLKELGPVLANAFGWRAVARELTGAVPGIGFIVRATISYSGTVTIGRAAQLYYETGENVTATQFKMLYNEAYRSSREKVRTLADALKRGKGGGGGGGGGRRLALPAAPIQEDALLEENEEEFAPDLDPIQK